MARDLLITDIDPSAKEVGVLSGKLICLIEMHEQEIAGRAREGGGVARPPRTPLQA